MNEVILNDDQKIDIETAVFKFMLNEYPSLYQAVWAECDEDHYSYEAACELLHDILQVCGH